MRRTTLILGLTLAVGIAVGAIGHQLLNAQPQPVTRTPLLKTVITQPGSNKEPIGESAFWMA